ncbi:hypothetical protein [Photobacterium aquae]|uniref:hypothetical protein n=1 Tax=Photobacterium aquae TaxID=1195763 RepID=UPI000ACFD7F1|nr:hypothetical protein [Photobacterium aquae]
MPVAALFWPLLIGTISYFMGVFTSEKLGNTVRIGIAVGMGFWLMKITGVIK